MKAKRLRADFFRNESRNSHDIDNKSDDLITRLWHDYYKQNTQR